MAAKNLKMLALTTVATPSVTVYTVPALTQARVPPGGITLTNVHGGDLARVSMSYNDGVVAPDFLVNIPIPLKGTFIYPGQFTMKAGDKIVASVTSGNVAVFISGFELDAI